MSLNREQALKLLDNHDNDSDSGEILITTTTSEPDEPETGGETPQPDEPEPGAETPQPPWSSFDPEDYNINPNESESFQIMGFDGKNVIMGAIGAYLIWKLI